VETILGGCKEDGNLYNGIDYDLIMKLAPEMEKIGKGKRLTAILDPLLMNRGVNIPSAEMLESYKKLSSLIKVPLQVLVPSRRNKNAEIIEDEKTPYIQFYRDFQELLERQTKLDQEALSVIGGFEHFTETREIARYPLENLIELIFNLHEHMKRISSDLVAEGFPMFIYTLYR
jgi:hypothetical protein